MDTFANEPLPHSDALQRHSAEVFGCIPMLIDGPWSWHFDSGQRELAIL